MHISIHEGKIHDAHEAILHHVEGYCYSSFFLEFANGSFCGMVMFPP